ncbi:MAG: S9 family peptidase, partial [Bacteroidetes bacterium]
MKQLRQLFIIILAVLFIFSIASSQEKKKITPELGYKTPAMQLTKQLPSISGWQDDKTYIESKKKEGEEKSKTYLIDAKSGKEKGEKKPDVNWDDFKEVVGKDFENAKPAVSNEKNTMHIYTKDDDLYVLNIPKKEFKRLTNNSANEKNPTFSPTGDWLAFTRDNNLFAIDLNTGKEYQYTKDGSDVVYSGWAAWVYWEEIFGRGTRYRAFWWSPDGKKLAFYRFDETNVPMFPIYNSDGQHGELEKTRYPKAGDENPEVRVGIVDIASEKTTWADFNEKDDQYFGTPYWTPDSKQFWVQWMNRGQDDLKIYSIDLSTGAKTEILDEKQPTWVDWYDDITFLKNNKGFIIKSDKDGWAHFYLHTMDGKLKNRITEGKWQVSGLTYLDEDDGVIYFTARKEASTRTDLYKVKLNGKGLKRLTFGTFTHSVQLSPEGSYFITTYSNVSTPPKKALCDDDGDIIRELGDSHKPDRKS